MSKTCSQKRNRASLFIKMSSIHVMVAPSQSPSMTLSARAARPRKLL